MLCKKKIMLLLLTVVFLFSSQQAIVVFASSDPGQSSAVAADVDAQEEATKADAVSLRFSSEQYPGESFSTLKLRSEQWSFRFRRDARLSVMSERPVRQLYFQFEKPCEWTLTTSDGTVFHRGGDGFIHDYIDLGQSVSNFTVDVSQDTYLTGVFGFTEGETPGWVQKWLPPCDAADLLVLPTHADDEFLWFGGALPYYAGELGYNVQVVYLTNHYEQTYREHERLNGLWSVGVRHYPIVCERFTDSIITKRYEWAVEKFGWENVLAFQVEMLRRFRPRVVIGHDIKGEYGHGTHILNAETLLKALELTNDPTAYPDSAEQYGLCSVQKCYLHLWNENCITVKWEDLKLSKFGDKSAMRMADQGFARHVSQYQFYSEPSAGQYNCRLFGLAYTNVGYDTPDRNDMFEHVDWTERARVYPSSPVEEAVVSATDAPPDMPDQAVSDPAENAIPTQYLLLAGGGVAVLLFTAGLVWRIHKRKVR